jgi:hypothetical protein
MTLRLRFRPTPRRHPARARHTSVQSAPPPHPAPAAASEAASTLASLLSPLTALCVAIGCWRLAQDLGLAGNFFVETGVFSHWQPWVGLALLLWLAGRRLNRSGEPATN